MAIAKNRYPGEKIGKDSCAPYVGDTDLSGTTVFGSKDFSDKQRAQLIVLNMDNNGGKLKSDYYGLSAFILPPPYTETYDDLKVPTALKDAVQDILTKDGLDYKFETSDGEDAAQIDHIVPSGKGGANSFLNAAVCSAKCNNKKKDTVIQPLIDHYTDK